MAHRILLTFLLVFVALTACGDPCEDLGTRVCNCRDSRSEINLCASQMQARMDLATADETSQGICMERLETCDCDALARGDWAACGLAEPPCAEGEDC
ncbi:MAG: hypothetical protein VX405_12635 [Myxococcota bacterium]|nr:hypothetical protein [Myxococcales bacterium]MEC7752340.1 hypothetical protein [Myxococcota bacterium]HBU49160.1 hypothetical protein [Myxococcales bacterium]